MKKTDLFPMSTPPTRPGSYEVHGAHGPLVYPFHWWTGRGWLDCADKRPTDYSRAAGRRVMVGFYIDGAKWRGLAKDPKGKA